MYSFQGSVIHVSSELLPLLVCYAKGHPGRCSVISAHSHLVFEAHTSHKINEGNKAYFCYVVIL